MDNLGIIKEFFSNMRCSQCNNFFEQESIRLLRQEGVYLVVKIACEVCGKNIGLAMLGLDRESLKKSMGTVEEFESIKFDVDSKQPIDYDDVIDAHNFIEEMGSDWDKYLPNKIEEKE